MKKFAFVALAFVVFFSSCSNDDNHNQPSQLSFFPLAVGKEWEYKTEAWLVENGDTLHHSSSENWKITKDTLISGAPVFVISKEYLFGNPVQVNNRKDYYKNTPAGFYGVATTDGGGTQISLRKANNNTVAKLFKSEFSNLKTFRNGLFIASPPLQLLKYPINITDTWTSHEFGTNAGVTREYLGTYNVTVPAGTFNCTKLQITLPGSFDTTYIYQYYASGKGLIKEERTLTGNSSSGPVSGYKATELQSTN